LSSFIFPYLNELEIFCSTLDVFKILD